MTDLHPQEPIRWSQSFADRAARLRPSEIREFLKLLGNPGVISFAGGIPDPDLFPVAALERAAGTILTDPERSAQALQYAASEGYAPLREWIAAYMTRMGAPCSSDNILLTTGSQQGLDLLGKLFIDPGDTVLTTAPTYLGALQAFDIYQPTYATFDPVTGEHPGADHPAIAYVTPDFANPSGETISLAARQQMLDTCEAFGIPLIEDAAYLALRFEGETVPPVLSLDIDRTGHIDRSRVIFAGTFSKTIAPGLRVGWLCAARELIQQVVLVRQAADLHGSMLDQMMVYEVVREGFDAQVARILPVYRRRRDVMLAALERAMPEGVSWTKPEGGMFIWVTLPEGLDSRALLRASLDSEGIIFVPGSSFFADGSGSRHVRLNYTRSDEATIDDGIGRLGSLIARIVASSEAASPALVTSGAAS